MSEYTAHWRVKQKSRGGRWIASWWLKITGLSAAHYWDSRKTLTRRGAERLARREALRTLRWAESQREWSGQVTP